jgi:signal transduction histidine kinase/ligand-binding sensor domain-containing protein
MPKKSRAFRFAGLPLCLFALVLSAAAGTPAESNPPFIVDSWTVENGPGKGPPDNEIISVVQTHDGYLWLGTLHGLVRFDGIKFTVFNVNNTPGLISDRIVYLYEDKQTNLWVGTESSGLLRMRDGVVQKFDLGEAAGKIIFADEDTAGTVWFCADNGYIFGIRDGKLSPLPATFSPQSLYYCAFRLRVSAANSVSWDLQNGQVKKTRGGIPEKDCGACPWQFNPVFTFFRSSAGIVPIQFDANVTAVCHDSDGNLIVGTHDDGIYWYDVDGNFRHISAVDGLSDKTVLSACVDRAGNLWIGTDGGGLDRIKRKMFSASAGFPSYDVQSLSADANGGLWMAFNAAGVSQWRETNGLKNFAIGRASNAWTVLVDRQQQVWAGTRDEGLFQLRGSRFQPAPGAAILGPAIFALFEGRDGQLWAGTQNGLANFDGQKWKLFTTREGLSENGVRAIAEDAGGNLWVGTESSGLNLFKDGKFISYRADANGLPGDDISCLYAEKEGVLWIGTGGHGLARLENGKWARYATTNGLVSDSINYITEDDAGFLWIGCNAGLMRLPKKSLNDFAAGRTNVISCRTYGKADGLPTRECSAGSQPATCRTSDGKSWFPTIKGLASVDPANLKPNPRSPLVMIESILVHRREQKTNQLISTWPPSITIPPGGAELEIHYSALNFSAPELVRFRCWLENHEITWSEASEERVARYPKLPPGPYTFHVKASNEDNVWSGPDAAVLSITVQPQFWQTGWFRLAAVVLILGIVAAIVRYVSTQKLQRQLQSLQQREALERERARIARDLHDQLGANLTQVALLGEMAEADKDAPSEVESHAQQISQTARETTRSLDEIVWAVNPANDTLDGLVNYAGKYAQEYLALAGLRCRADFPAQLPVIPIPPEVRHNVFLAFKEAVHNVVKHAQATEARIRLRLEPGNFILEIEDNGRGMGNQTVPQNRNGLRNMKKRMEDIHGEFSISGGADGGTVVRLKIPISKLS